MLAPKALLEIFDAIRPKWISQNSKKGHPLGRQGVESLKGGIPLPPNSVTGCLDSKAYECQVTIRNPGVQLDQSRNNYEDYLEHYQSNYRKLFCPEAISFSVSVLKLLAPSNHL